MNDPASTQTTEEVQALRDALIPFARIWAMNAPLAPPHDAGVRDYAAGLWPSMGDAKAAYDLVWRHRKDGQ